MRLDALQSQILVWHARDLYGRDLYILVERSLAIRAGFTSTYLHALKTNPISLC